MTPPILWFPSHLLYCSEEKMDVHYISIFSAIKLIINRIKVKVIFNKFYKPSGSRIYYGVAEWCSRRKE